MRRGSFCHGREQYHRRTPSEPGHEKGKGNRWAQQKMTCRQRPWGCCHLVIDDSRTPPLYHVRKTTNRWSSDGHGRVCHWKGRWKRREKEKKLRCPPLFRSRWGYRPAVVRRRRLLPSGSNWAPPVTPFRSRWSAFHRNRPQLAKALFMTLLSLSLFRFHMYMYTHPAWRTTNVMMARRDWVMVTMSWWRCRQTVRMMNEILNNNPQQYKGRRSRPSTPHDCAARAVTRDKTQHCSRETREDDVGLANGLRKQKKYFPGQARIQDFSLENLTEFHIRIVDDGLNESNGGRPCHSLMFQRQLGVWGCKKWAPPPPPPMGLAPDAVKGQSLRTRSKSTYNNNNNNNNNNN